MMHKKILVVSLGRKALEEYTKNILLGISSSKFDLICSKYSETNYELNNIIFRTKTYNSKKTFISNSLLFLPLLLIKVIKINSAYDIIFLPSSHPWNFPIIILGKLLNKKIIHTIHDVESHPGEENWLLDWLMKTAFKYSDNLVFLSYHVRDIAINKYNLNQPSVIIPLGHFPLPNLVSRKGKEGKRILFLGRISKYKGIELLIEAVNLMPIDSYDSLVIAGMPVYDVIIPEGNPKITLEARYLTEDEMSDFLNNSDIIVYPYIEASQSAMVLSGVQAEKPMICTKVGGLLEQLSDKECIFVEPNAFEIKEAILRLLNDNELYSFIQENLRLKKESFTWADKSSELLKFVDEIRS
jgi:glycosyltransferase involved in cell wall biosynthesis